MHLSRAQFTGAFALLIVIWLVIIFRLVFYGS